MSAALSHATAYLERLKLQIRRETLAARALADRRGHGDLPGLVITDVEIDALLDDLGADATNGRGAVVDGVALDDLATELEQELANATARLRAIELAAFAADDRLPLNHLSATFGLGELERDALVIALAAELDLKYERLFAYLQDDIAKQRPTIDLIFRLRGQAEAGCATARAAFLPGSPLVDWRLIGLHDEPNARSPVLLARYLKLDNHIAEYLLGSTAIDPRIAPALAKTPPTPLAPLPEACADRLDRWAEAWRREPNPHPLAQIQGRRGSGRRTAARHLAEALGRPLRLYDVAQLPVTGADLADWFRLVERDARLNQAVVAWHNADRLLQPTEADPVSRRDFLRALAGRATPTVVMTEHAWRPPSELASAGFFPLELPDTTYADRRRLWRASLNGSAPSIADPDIAGLASRFRLTSGQIRDAIALAGELAWAREPSALSSASLADLELASRQQVSANLGELAKKLPTPFDWGDIVLPRPQLTVLRLIGATMRQRGVVYGDWGFDRKLAPGDGLVALLAGPSGTGKTMAAQILARDLGLDLYRVDLASVVSKYIGETEKNLDQIFTGAQHTAAILFFDEADALFGKRSEVRDAHDRYANIETAYLLQRIEAHSGLVVLATNLKKNMDEAFVRRMHFSIDFPLPEEAERLEIWRRAAPQSMPRVEPLDLEFLAKKLKFSGGNIRNATLTAAFLAADAGDAVSMPHLVRGAAYEMQKMGKLVIEADFEPYAEHARL